MSEEGRSALSMTSRELPFVRSVVQKTELTEAHLREWEKLYVPRITPDRYLLIVETGDEVLDYRQAVSRYAGAEQVVVSGGDHSLQSFPQHLPRILEFSRAAAL